MSRNVDVTRSALEGWNRGDFDAFLGAPHPDIEFQTSGLYPGIDPVYRGVAGLRRFWTTFREPWESLHINVDQLREVDGEVVALATFEGHARDGMTVHREAVWTFSYVDDLCVHARAYRTWTEALEAVGLSE